MGLKIGPIGGKQEVNVHKIFTIIMYALWTCTLLGVLVVTFTNFQYVDLNVIVGTLFFFSVINSFFSLNRAKR